MGVIAFLSFTRSVTPLVSVVDFTCGSETSATKYWCVVEAALRSGRTRKKVCTFIGDFVPRKPLATVEYRFTILKCSREIVKSGARTLKDSRGTVIVSAWTPA